MSEQRITLKKLFLFEHPFHLENFEFKNRFHLENFGLKLLNFVALAVIPPYPLFDLIGKTQVIEYLLVFCRTETLNRNHKRYISIFLIYTQIYVPTPNPI